MALKIDDEFLRSVGIENLPEEDKQKLLTHIRETLETRVGTRLAGAMKPEQLDEFERFIDNKDEAGALRWLESNFPDYPQVVQRELEELRNEIKQNADEIVKSIKEG